MKLKALKPFWKSGTVILPGEDFETHEQHGRELVTGNFALAATEDQAPAEKPALKSKATKKAN